MLRFPDAMIVDAPFGIYVASEVQKIQMIFIRSCTDESSTRRGCSASSNGSNSQKKRRDLRIEPFFANALCGLSLR